MANIKDIYGKDYEISNLVLFKKHIMNFHTNAGIPDNTIHEENGFYFKIDEKFLKKMNELL